MNHNFVIQRAVLLLPLGIIALTGAAVGTRVLQALQHPERMAETELSAALKRKVEVRRLDIATPGVIHIEGLRVASTRAAMPLLEVPEADIRYDWRGLLSVGGKPASVITSARVVRPRLLIERYRTNRFNLQELFRPSKRLPADAGFRASVNIDRARIVFVDHAARVPNLPAVNTATISATLDGSSPPLVTISAYGEGSGDRIGNAACVGNLEAATGALNLHISAATRDAGYWSRYFTAIPHLSVQRGAGQVVIDLWKPYKFSALNSDIRISVADGTVGTDYTRTPLSRVNGEVSLFTAGTLAAHIRMSARAAGTPLSAEGSVLTGTGPTRLAILGKASRVSVSAIERALGRTLSTGPIEASSPLAVSGYVFGPANDLVASGTIDAARGRVLGSVVRNAAGDVVYRSGLVELPSFAATVGTARVAGRGYARPSDGTLRFEANLPPVALSAVRLPLRDIAGVASARVRVAGTMKEPRTEVVAYAPRVRVAGVLAQDLAGVVRVDGGGYTLTSAQGRIGGGVVHAAGALNPSGGLNVSFVGAAVPLQSVLSRHKMADASGSLFADGTITGSLDSPRIEAKARVFGLTAGGQSADIVSGSLAYADRHITLNETRVASYPSEGVVAGTLSLPARGEPALNLRATLKQGLLETLLADRGIRNTGIVGSVTGSATITGTTVQPVVGGNVSVRDAFVGPLPVTMADARFRYRNGQFKVTDLVAASNGASAVVPELSLEDGMLSGRFTIEGIRPSQFPRPGLPWLSLDGVFQVRDGEVFGPLKDRIVSGTVESSGGGFTVNGVGFDQLVAKGRWNGDQIALGSASVGLNGVEVLAARDVTIGLPDEKAPFSLTGALDVTAFPVTSLVAITKGSPWLQEVAHSELRQRLNAVTSTSVDGNLSANLRLNGTPADFEVKGNASLGGPSGFRFGDFTLDRASIQGSIRNARLTAGEPFDALIEVPDGGVEVSYRNEAQDIDMVAFGGFTGQVRESISHAKVDIYNVPISMLRPILQKGAAGGVDGVVGSLVVEAKGRMLQPEISASLSAELHRQGSPKSRLALDTQNIRVSEGRAEVNGIRLTAGAQSFDFSGHVPFHYPWLEAPANTDQSFQVRADLAKQSLDVLELLPGDASAGLRETLRKASGSLSGNISAGGLLVPGEGGGNGVRDLKVSGALSLADGQFEFSQLDTAFKDVNAEFAFDGDRIRIPRFVVTSSSGGNLEAGPESGVRFERGRLTNVAADIGLLAKGFRVEAKPDALGYGERVRGTLDGRLEVTGPLSSPLVAGEVTLSRVEVLPPSKPPAPRTQSKPWGFRPAFQLTVIGGKDVWLRSSALRMRLDDKKPVEFRRLRIGGQYPFQTVIGTLTSREGAINYPTARFRLTDAEATVSYVGSDQPSTDTGQASPAYSFRAAAQSRLYATLNGRREPVTVYITAKGPTDTRLGNAVAGTEILPYKLEIRSVPSLPERQLVSLITREQAIMALTKGTSTPEEILMQETVNVLQTSVLPAALSGFETSLSEALGLESLTLEYVDRRRGINVSASKMLTNRVRVELTVPVGEGQSSSSQAWQGRLSYSLTPSLRLSLMRQRGPYLIGVVPASPVTSVTGSSPTADETAILLEGTIGF